MIDRYLLRYFLAVVDHGNFSRAAAACNVSQPTLSVGVAKLERELGNRLFHRSNQRVELTPAGTRFLDHARRIEREFNLAQTAMGIAADAPALRIGLLRSIAVQPIARAVRECHDANGKVELVEGSDRELSAHLVRGRIDCALTLMGRGEPRFAEQTIVEEGYRLALPDRHPLAHRQVIEAEELADNVMMVRRHCEILAATSRHFTERSVRPHFAYRSRGDERILALVAAGLGITVIPESLDAPGIVKPALAGFDHRRRIGLAHLPDRELPDHPLINALRRHLVSQGFPDR